LKQLEIAVNDASEHCHRISPSPRQSTQGFHLINDAMKTGAAIVAVFLCAGLEGSRWSPDRRVHDIRKEHLRTCRGM
jgi:hypothetical protein